MRAKAIGPLLGTVAVAALLLPGLANGAKPASRGSAHRTPAELTESFQVQGTNGFSVEVTLRDRHQLSISASTPEQGNGVRSAIYSLPAAQAPGSDDIDARIGKLGRIDVRFVPGSVKEAPSILPGCSGPKTVIEEGHFVGLISFRGEQGYTQALAAHAAGTVTTYPPLTCKQVKPSQQHGKVVEEEGEEVHLTAAVDGPVSFDASRLALQSKGGKNTVFTNFVAVAVRHQGPIKEISYALSLLQPASRFLSPDPLHPTTEAVIRPPFPFSGSATFKSEPGKSASWSGDLKVELPGFGDVPLAGSGSRATMCEAPGCPEL